MPSRSKKAPRSLPARRSLRRSLLGLETLETRRTMASNLLTLVPDQLTTIQGQSAQVLDVLANDLFEKGYDGPRKITGVSVGDHGGEVSIAADGRSLRYTPPPGFVSRQFTPGNFFAAETERFSYIVDGAHETSVDVAVRPLLLNDDLSFEINERDRVLNVLANDPFFDGYAGPKKITAFSATTAGGLLRMMDNDRALLYSPIENFAGREEFSYIVDGKYEAHVFLNIRTAVQSDYFGNVMRNASEQTLSVLDNDCYAENITDFQSCTQVDVSQITSVTSPNHGGQVRIAADGRSLQYLPAVGFVGTETFSYTADQRYPATVTITVNQPNDYYSLVQDAAQKTLDVLANDLFPTDYAGAKVITDVSAASGTVQIAADGKSLIYSSPRNWQGTDSFTYTVDDQFSATVSITLNRMLWDDWVQVIQNSPGKKIDVLANDQRYANSLPLLTLITDPNANGDEFKITQVSNSQNGATVTIADDGQSLFYKPAQGFYGVDRLTYTVNDFVTANVDIYVWQPFGDIWQYAQQYTQSNELDVMRLGDYYRLGQMYEYAGAKKLTAVGTPDHGGSVSISADGSRLIYTPLPEFHGEEKFSYTVDGEYTATVTVYVQPSVQEDTLNVQQNSHDNSLAVLLNDNFPANYRGAKKITAVSNTKHGGTVTIDATTAIVTYTPAQDFAGRDSFTYTVDGVQSTTVSVNVLRRLRDDDFHVPANGTASSLPVLVNDDFGSTYTGAKRITAVRDASAGGTLTIADDGKSLRYAPKAGFVGTETLSYEVDGQFVATVHVVVGDTRVTPPPKFATASELEAYLRDTGLAKFADQFGKDTWSWATPLFASDIAAFGLGSDSLALHTASANRSANTLTSAPDHSDTNTQVAGVDEGDLVETDGNFIYVLTGNELVIADSFPAADAHVVSRYKFAGQPTAQFLNGNLLTVISHTNNSSWTDVWPLASSRFMADSYLPWGPTGPRGVTVTVLDVSNRSAPQLVQETKLDGDYFDARATGNFVHIVAKTSFDPPSPKTTCRAYTAEERADYIERNYPAGSTWGEPYVPAEKCVYETREEYLARSSSFVNDVLPHYTTYDKNGNVLRTGLLVDATDIYGEGGSYHAELFSLLTIDITSPDPGPVATTGLLTGSDGVWNSPVLFASRDSLYLFDAKSTTNPEDPTVTHVWKVQFDAANGRIQPVAEGTIPGTVLNQFSIDETDGLLRVATTNFSPTASRTENNVFVLRDDGGVLEYVGSVQDLAPTETIYSVRFFDDRAIVVTFRQIDPLFTIDLSDPSQPQVAGELKLPGFSTYIQPIDRDHVLTFGRGGPNGWDGPPQVSLFNIQDLQHPTLIDQASVGTRTWSEDAWNDHHAVSYFSQYHVLAIPSNRTEYDYNNLNGSWMTQYHETFVFKIDTSHSERSDDGIQVLGQIAQDSTVRRNVRIEDSLYSVADGNISIVNVLDPNEHRGSVDLRSPETETPPTTAAATTNPDDTATPFDDPGLGRAISAAQKSLATRLQLGKSAGVLVTAEPSDAGSNAFQLVLRSGDRQFLFNATADGEANELATDFTFSPVVTTAWHNAAQPLDANGDGFIAPDDALAVINQLNLTGARTLNETAPVRAISAQVADAARSLSRHIDIDGDGYLAPLDALLVINHLNRQPAASNNAAHGEGEFAPVSVASAPTTPTLSSSATAIASITDELPPPSQPGFAWLPLINSDTKSSPNTLARTAPAANDQALEELLAEFAT